MKNKLYIFPLFRRDVTFSAVDTVCSDNSSLTQIPWCCPAHSVDVKGRVQWKWCMECLQVCVSPFLSTSNHLSPKKQHRNLQCAVNLQSKSQRSLLSDSTLCELLKCSEASGAHAEADELYFRVERIAETEISRRWCCAHSSARLKLPIEFLSPKIPFRADWLSISEAKLKLWHWWERVSRESETYCFGPHIDTSAFRPVRCHFLLVHRIETNSLLVLVLQEPILQESFLCQSCYTSLFTADCQCYFSSWIRSPTFALPSKITKPQQ